LDGVRVQAIGCDGGNLDFDGLAFGRGDPESEGEGSGAYVKAMLLVMLLDVALFSVNDSFGEGMTFLVLDPEPAVTLHRSPPGRLPKSRPDLDR
jgi:hypothetical protein